MVEIRKNMKKIILVALICVAVVVGIFLLVPDRGPVGPVPKLPAGPGIPPVDALAPAPEITVQENPIFEAYSAAEKLQDEGTRLCRGGDFGAAIEKLGRARKGFEAALTLAEEGLTDEDRQTDMDNDYIRDKIAVVDRLIAEGRVGELKHNARQAPGRPVMWRPGNYNGMALDAVQLGNGSVCVLFKKQGPMLYNAERHAFDALHFREKCGLLKEPFDYLQVLPDKQDEGAFYLMIKRERDAIHLYRYDGTWQHRIRIKTRSPGRQPPKEPRFPLSVIVNGLYKPKAFGLPDGSIWIYAPGNGALCIVRDGQAAEEKYQEQIEMPEGARGVAELKLAGVTPVGTVIFRIRLTSNSSAGNPRYLLFRNQTWSLMDDLPSFTHVRCLWGDNGIVLADMNGINWIDVEDPWNPVRKLDIRQRRSGSGLWSMSFMHQMKDGTLVTFWLTKKMYDDHRNAYRPAEELYSRIRELQADTWKDKHFRADMVGPRYEYRDRPVFEDRRGGLWVGAQLDGLLYRSPQGDWLRCGWEHGIPVMWPRKFVRGTGDDLWVLERNGTCVLVNMVKVLGPERADRPWKMEFFDNYPALDSEGNLYGVRKTGKAAAVVTLRPEGDQRFPLPGEITGREFGNYSFAKDSEGGVWAFHSKGEVRYHDGEHWRRWQTDNRLPGIEKAYQEIAGKPADFKIGNTRTAFHPAFSGDGRVVYKNRFKRVACFADGKWRSPQGGFELSPKGATADYPPYFIDGKVAAVIRGAVYLRDDPEWQAGEYGDRAAGKWVKDESRTYRSPHVRGTPFHSVKKEDALKVCPVQSYGKRNEFYDVRQRYWVKGNDCVTVFAGGAWATMPLAETPLDGGVNVYQVMVDSGGRYIFDCGYESRYWAFYTPGPLKIEPVSLDLGGVYEPFALIKPEWKSADPAGNLIVRARVDQSLIWTAMPATGLDPGLLTKGTHELEVDFIRRRGGLAEQAIVFTFEVTYDIKEILTGLAAALTTGTAAERQEIGREILKYGEAAREYLADMMKSKDPALRRTATQLYYRLGPKPRRR
ncbi:hypothetical protein ACFL4W_02800 [Planctomycetota bacterium]